MMPRSCRHGSASLNSGILMGEPHGHDSVIEGNLNQEHSLGVNVHSGDLASESTLGCTPPSALTKAPTLPERRKDKPPVQVPCRYFNAGYCARGGECKYRHDLEKVRLQKVHFQTVLKSRENARLREEAPKSDPLLPKEYMIPGQHQRALTYWRNDYWETKIIQARAHQSQHAKDKEGSQSERSKVNKDVKRLQNKVDPIGESARKVADAKNHRKTIFVKGNTEGPGVPIPLEAEGCPICQDDPRAIKVYGLMKNCNHVFCYECIISWRRTNVTNKNCPICRTRSPFILKSSVYPYSPGVKLEDNVKPAEGPKTLPEPNKPAPNKPWAQADDSEDGIVSFTDDTDKGRGRTDTQKCTSMDFDEARDSTLLLNIHEVRYSSCLDKPDMIDQSTSFDPSNEEKISSVESGHYWSVLDTSASNMQNSDHGASKRKRSRRKPAQDPDDPNPAKTVLLKNFLEKCKTTPCKYFCNPKHARVVSLDHFCAETQSSLWGEQHAGQTEDDQDIGWGHTSTGLRKIPYCRYGNNCNFAHPHPEKPDEEYKYDDWERRILGFSRKRKRRGVRNQHPDDGHDVFAIAIASLQI